MIRHQRKSEQSVRVILAVYEIPRARRCQLDHCGAWSWRRCRVCERWVCRGHRFGAGHWWRCYACPYELLAEVLRAEHDQAREERQNSAGATGGPPVRLVAVPRALAATRALLDR